MENISAADVVTREDLQELSHLLPALWHTLMRATHAAAAMPALESHVSVLRKLTGSGSMSPAQLADQLHLARSTVSNLIKPLVAAGLVDRLPSDTDGRSVIIAATPRANQIIENSRAGRLEALEEALGQVPAADCRMIVAALPSLEVLLHALEDMSGGDPV